MALLPYVTRITQQRGGRGDRGGRGERGDRGDRGERGDRGPRDERAPRGVAPAEVDEGTESETIDAGVGGGDE
jgi:hypothetical protein